MKCSVQTLSPKLFLGLLVIGALAPVQAVEAVTILPGVHNGSTVWTGNSPELDAAAIGAIVGLGGLTSFYEAGFGSAQLTTTGPAASQVVFTAKQAGTAGHDVTVRIINPGTSNSPLSVSVNGPLIEITLATSASGVATSTAAQVAAAVNASPAASALVQAQTPGAGSGLVAALGATQLAPVIVEAGAYAAAYATAFTNSPTSPRDAQVSYGSGASIGASSLFLYVRDTGAQPAYYLYDLLAPATAWNGLDNLLLQGFWPGNGAINELKIVGIGRAPTPVPEGSSLALFAIGMGLLAWRRVARRLPQ